MTVRHVLKDSDLTISEQQLVLATAEKIAANHHCLPNALSGHSIGLFFQKPSLRTRVSSETACVRLGAHAMQLRDEELHFHRGETPEDSIKVLGGYLSLVMARVRSHSMLQELAAPNVIPIVNGLCDKWHPLQALADLLTLRQTFGDIRGKKLAYVGDGNNVCASLLVAGVMSGLNVVAACPKRYFISDAVLSEANSFAAQTGGFASATEDPFEAIKEADAVYTDVWISMGDEDEREERLSVLAPYQVNAKLVKAAKPDALVMHCLPAHRGEEITADVLDGRQSVVIREAHNRMPSAAALFLFLLRPDICANFAK